MKRILGLDLGTASIGWAIVNENDNNALDGIVAAGSRIIPTDADTLSKFAEGNAKSQTKDRREARSARRLLQRHQLRRERLNRVLGLMGFLPAHYADSIDRYGKFKNDDGCKLAWRKGGDGRWQFLFGDSFEEMLAEFRAAHPDMVKQESRVPYDWTIYYLRKKALTKPIRKEELAWLLLNFNQKRGYYQTRGEDEENNTDKSKKIEEYYALKVIDVEDSGDKSGNDTWYNIRLENGMVYRRTASTPPDWIGKTKEFIVTTDIDADGNPKKDKEGNVKRSMRMPRGDEWALLKIKTESDIEKSGKTVGEYIYDALLADPTQKIKGKLVRTVERKFYKKELAAIIDSQKRFIAELNDKALYDVCIKALYESNESYRESISARDFGYLLIDNIIFYQRPLKSKKSLIAECPYENHTYIVDKETGETGKIGVKCVAKSNPLYQEFRVWQFISNLRIVQNEKTVNDRLRIDVDVTSEFLYNENRYVELFEFINSRDTISQDVLFSKFFKRKKTKDKKWPYHWNYVEDKKYSANETRAMMLNGLSKAGVSSEFLTPENEKRLWHILYSVSDRNELHQAMKNFADRHNLGESFVDVFTNMPPYKKDYGAYSEKAIRKLLQLMRMGKYWDADKIDEHTKERIQKIIDGERDENIDTKVRERLANLTDISQFKGMPLWLACYVVYNRHSEATEICRWNSPDDIDAYLRRFKQHSLHNPIVEQVVTETLRTVRDIWRKHGRPDEIHIELGREMKNSAETRAKITKANKTNEDTNQRIRILLTEFMNPDLDIEGVRPYSPMQQEKLRLYEECAIASNTMDNETAAIMNKFAQNDATKRPTHSEIIKYKNWLEQNYRSPYTGRMIPLSKLFTEAYQIEHIIPQSRYFDDSLSNKVVCEAEVNQLKDKQLGYEFIKKHGGQRVRLSQGGEVTILSVGEYEDLVKKTFANNKSKMSKLLMDDIPDSFIERQLNDTRYISKLIMALMSNIVREDNERDATSKNVIACNGNITTLLKRDWGLDDVWNNIVLPRFERLEQITSGAFTTTNTRGHRIPCMPQELLKGFSKKRIDHRHHAMDAIVIACTTRSHVNLLNNEAAKSGNRTSRHDLSRKLRNYERVQIQRDNKTVTIDVAREFIKPWQTFTTDVQKTLSDIVVSFKQNQRVLKTSKNKSWKFVDGKKKLVTQENNDNGKEHITIRKSLHKATVYGEVNLRQIVEVSFKEAIKQPQRIVEKDLKKKVKELLQLGYSEKQMKQYFENNKEIWNDLNLKKVKTYRFTQENIDKQTQKVKERYFATRYGNDLITVFKDAGTPDKARTQIKKITDTGIQKILLRHLEANDNDPKRAFSPDGIDRMNLNIATLNQGKAHKPIYKVRLYEQANKFPIGSRGNRSTKFVEADKGTNLFFAVYEKECTDATKDPTQKQRSYATIPLRTAISRLKNNLPPAPDEHDGARLLFVLSPNDLVYLPTSQERESGCIDLPLRRDRIYKMVSATRSECYFIAHNVAAPILDKQEFKSLNKMEQAITGEMIKKTCLPLRVDRLGNITHINNKEL